MVFYHSIIIQARDKVSSVYTWTDDTAEGVYLLSGTGYKAYRGK